MLSKKLFQKIVEITENQRVLVYKNQQLIDVLTPGKHKRWDFKNELSFVYFDINTLYFSEQNAERLYRNNPQLSEHIFHCKLSNTEVGLLYVNDLLEGIVAPSEQLYLWQDAGDIRLEKVSIDEEIALDDKTLFLINRAGANTASRLIKSERTVAVKPIADLNIAKEHIGLLYVNGQLLKQLTPGHYGFWQFNHEIELKTFDCRTQLLEISGQEILSKDRVSLRINLSANIKVHDAQLAARSVDNVNDFVYKALQLALREAVGTKSLDDILLDKLYVNETVKELVAQSLTDIGITLENVGVKDIILPGEMKIILNQVVEAQKAAEANVIKRREETSATRSLHNTAKMIENNPTLMRLKELEALEKVAERINNLTVYGGLEGLMNGAVKIA
ncbi:slipin family protein [Pseudoalteromonas sp. SR44-5]|uniref:slipin family protein n=1 Tax=unclassified Pseudoalteromonas TaxID=194690 RepID=UPI0016032048|nr:MULTISPECIES: slipin family protein [unclassified Pseudoalteromonas]MBB1368389.1 slipin family protein [Pseudoalteromonas sp. SR44-5]MBB1479060.1 slipin family protein [Pseudoalteromonas sp. SG41-2]